jgi:hypothetical protein
MTTNTSRNESFIKSTPPMLVDPSTHTLSLKVMRIKKCLNNITMPVLLEKSDFLGSNPNSQKTPYPERSIYNNTSGPVMDGLGYIESWTLPEKFGEIYVGETLSCYIAVHNESYFVAKNVVLKVELVANATRTTIFDLAQAPLAKIDPLSFQDFVVEHPLNESESHLLACTVTYTIEENGIPDNKTLKNVYKFVVTNAVVLKNIKIVGQKSTSYLNFDLINQVDGPLYIESVKFDSHISFDCTDLSTHNSGPDYDHPLLKAESRRFLFELKPKDQLTKPPQLLGKVIISWRSSLNQSGQVVTAVQQKTFPKAEVELEMIGGKEKIFAETKFVVRWMVHNRTQTNLNLVMLMDPEKLFPLCVHGVSTKKIGIVAGNTTFEFDVDMFAMGVGVQKIGTGIYLKDVTSGRVWSCLNLGSVYVE